MRASNPTRPPTASTFSTPTGQSYTEPPLVHSREMDQHQHAIPESLSHTHAEQLRCTLLSTFLSILGDNTPFAQVFSDDTLATTVEGLPFAMLIWLLHALTLCGSDQFACENDWILLMPFKSAHQRGLRTVVFEYLWHYMCTAHLQQAFFYGIPWTFRFSWLFLHAPNRTSKSIWAKNCIYTSNFVDTILILVVQPLLLFYASRELGRHLFPRCVEAESCFYTGILLHVIKIFLETLEQVTVEREWVDFQPMLFFLLGTTLAIFYSKGYIAIPEEVIDPAWGHAKTFYAMAEIAKKIERQQAAD